MLVCFPCVLPLVLADCDFLTLEHVYSVIFCFKQKAAYEVRISDWSSDVCSSDLAGLLRHLRGGFALAVVEPAQGMALLAIDRVGVKRLNYQADDGRSEERRVGKECVRTCSSRW